MKTFLVLGLESSCTRYVSTMIAANLGIIPEASAWDGHQEVKNEEFAVVHRSLPYNSRDFFVDENYCMEFDKVVVCTRDATCSLKSKMGLYQPDKILAEKEQEKGREIMAKVISLMPDSTIYSYESAFSIGQAYNEKFMKSIGVPYAKPAEIRDINSKYF